MDSKSTYLLLSVGLKRVIQQLYGGSENYVIQEARAGYDGISLGGAWDEEDCILYKVGILSFFLSLFL